MSRAHTSTLVALAVIAALTAGCSSDQAAPTTTAGSTSAAPSTATPTTAAPSTAAPSTAAPSIPPVTSVAPTSAAPTTVTCPVATDTDVQSDGFPGRLSGLVGADVRTGVQPCSERFVIELQGTGDFPGWWVRYQDAPLTDDPRGEPVEVAGSAFIVVTLESWMTNPDDEGYHGPTRITPTNVSHINELVMLGNFESVTTWAIGVDQKRPFTVTTLDSPPRLVIDIATS